MTIGCSHENCTVAETGICLLNNPVETCPNRNSPDDKPEIDSYGPDLTPPLPRPPEKPRFNPSLTLSLDQAQELMAGDYCHLIGIIGAPDAGKTACLVSLYLLVARNKLNGFKFANSRSLRAFEDLSQGTRRWPDGQMPEQLTAHTQLEEGRSAGFLHLRLRSDEDGNALDLLLPDLPGEWTDSLVDEEREDRLAFLKRADAIWLMVDGRQLCTPNNRQASIHRLKLTMHRLVNFLVTVPPIHLVVTRRDQVELSEKTLQSLKNEAERLGINLEAVMVAPFSSSDLVEPGVGIPDLIAKSIGTASEAPEFWPDTGVPDSSGRAFLRYRYRGKRT